MNLFARMFNPPLNVRRHPLYANRRAGDVIVPVENARRAVQLAKELEGKKHLSAVPVYTIYADGTTSFAVVTSAAPTKGLIRF